MNIVNRLMNIKKLFNTSIIAVMALLMGHPALGAPPVGEDIIVFSPLDLSDYSGKKVSNGLFTHQGQTYAVILDGMSIGGAIAKGVIVTGTVTGLTDLTNLADTYLTQLAVTDEVSSPSFWIKSNGGVQIQLQTNHPEVSIAAGGDSVTLEFAPAP